MKEHQFHNVLVVRTDRIGDVVLSLPMVTVLRSSFPAARITMLLRSYTRELAEGFVGLDGTIVCDRDGEPKPFFSFLSELRSLKFDLAVVAHPTVRVAVLLFLARIPVRVGTGYRWYSFLFNTRVFEHRKTAEKHEAEYNLSLLRAVGCNSSSAPYPVLLTSAKDEESARGVWTGLRLDVGGPVAVLHPGSGGSARDWSPQNFGELATALTDDGFRVVVTGAANEESLVDLVVELSGRKAIPLVGRLSLKALAAFLRSADVFVSGSTGPLHIAAAVGTPVIGFYPPILECSPRRWGPLTNKKVVFTADRAACPRCKGGPCQGDDCMDQITVEEVRRAAGDLASLHSKAHQTNVNP